MNFSLLAAATMVLIPRFKAKEVVKAIRDYHPTIFPGIPTLYLALMREAGKQASDLRSIKFCFSGAAPLPKQVQADFEAATRGQLVEGYGLSEAAPMTHGNPFTAERRHGSIGLPLPDAEAAVAPVPDAYRGETVAAFVVLKPGIEASEETKQELITYCEHALTAYKVPKRVEFRQSLPKSLIGKVIRRQLQPGSSSSGVT